MRIYERPRRYLPRHWLLLLKPLFRYSTSRRAYVLRLVGEKTGPVLRPDRRAKRQPRVNARDRRGRARTI
jgi:hypothetical protein